MKRESFIFYKSFYDSIKELDPLDQVQIYDAIFNYQFEGKEIELNGVCKSIFTLIIPQLEANNKRYLNGLKGGAPKGNQNATKKQPKNNLDLTKKQPNENDNVNENENVNVNANDNVIYIIDYLNKKTNKHFKYTDANKNKIKARLKEKYTIEDFEKVIDKKTKEWLNDEKMNTYLRPETLFGNKFESYLQQEIKNNNVPNWFNKEVKEEQATDEEIQKLENRIKNR